MIGMYSVFTAFLNDGDEVIMFEPFFDQYLPSIVFNGGKCVYVPLHPPSESKEGATSNDWTIDLEEVRCVRETHAYIRVSRLLHFLAVRSLLGRG